MNLEISLKDCQRRYGKQGQYYLGPDETSELPPDNEYHYGNHDFDGQPAFGRQGWDYYPKDHTIRWDGNEKFYCYPEWITLLVREVLAPRGYIVNGSVEYENRANQYDSNHFDEKTRNERNDVWGTIEICNNVIYADHPEWIG